MEIRHLRYFVTLAQTLSFTKAAEALYISQSTLSQQIADLEGELNIKLFERTRRSVRLTEAGEWFLEEARPVLTSIDHLHDAARSNRQPLQTLPLRIGFDLRVLGGNLLRDTITDCIFSHRDGENNLSVTFSAVEYSRAMESLQSGAFDLCFFLSPRPSLDCDTSIETSLLYVDEMVVALRCPNTIEDTVENARNILMHRGVTLLEGETRGMIQAIRLFEHLHVEPPIHFAETRETMMLSFTSGERACVLPEGILAQQEASDIRVLHFGHDEARLYVLAAWNTRDMHPLVPNIVDAAQRALAKRESDDA